MIAKCILCSGNFEAERSSAQFCSDTHKASYHRKKKDGTLEAYLKGVSSTMTKSNVNDPTIRITIVPEEIKPGYYYSETFSNLIEELELKPIEHLKKEGYFIPNWKLIGLKKMPTPNQIKGLAGGMTVDQLNLMS